MLFFLGTHEVSWLGRTDVPLFISHRRLARQFSYPEALGPWACDSGGFSELSMYGTWQTRPADYARACLRYQLEIGNMMWAAIQDWMCEPVILQRTGLSIPIHQLLSVRSYLTLSELAPSVPWTPVLQGWESDDYMRHIDMYAEHGVYLDQQPVVGVGTMCRRQATVEAVEILTRIVNTGIRVHGFGFKVLGLENVHHILESADSLAWSFTARMKGISLPGHGHICSSCLEYALRWRNALLLGMQDGGDIVPVGDDD